MLGQLVAGRELPATGTASRNLGGRSTGRGARFGSKVGQISPKWDKSGIFSDQIQYIFAHGVKMY